MESKDIRKLIEQSAKKAVEESRSRRKQKKPINKTCLSYWYPKICDLVPTPNTIIVDASEVDITIHQEYCELKHRNELDKIGSEFVVIRSKEEGELAEMNWNRLVGKVIESALKISPAGPWFLRTGLTSGKHDFNRTCYVTDIEKIEYHMGSLVCFSQLCDMFGLEISKFVVREYLPVKPVFKCKAYGCMPVIREIRVFVDGGRVAYFQPYWPADAIRQGHPDDPEWEKKIHLVQDFSSYDYARVFGLAAACGYACTGRWSVDILETDRGWMVTDMAEAEKSYGYDSAKYIDDSGSL